MEGWDIAVQLDEDPRLGNNLIECLEYADGVRTFALIDVNLPGLEGAVVAARIRGVIGSMGILRCDIVQLLDDLFRELSNTHEHLAHVGVLLAEVCPRGSGVRLAMRNHRGALLLRRPALGDVCFQHEGGKGQVSELQCTEEAGRSGGVMTTVDLEPREAVLLVSRFASDVGDSVSVRESRHSELATKAREAVDAGSSTAIDGIITLGSLVRESAGADWPNRLLSMVWIRRSAIVV